MRVITERISKTKPLRQLPRPPQLDRKIRSLSGKELLRWLKAQGARPVEPELKRRLIASGNWGMPKE
jgi:hypothetical protein